MPLNHDLARAANIDGCHKKNLYQSILITRFIIFLLQFLSNRVCLQHRADAFRSPSLARYSNLSTYRTMNGFFSWDSQYFLHITLSGYTHEQILAFFPLYPVILKLIPYPEYLPLFIFILNATLHYKTAITLYKITSILYNKQLAKKTSLLFCWNPATIFFVAPYSESLFAFLSFSAILHCLELKKLNFSTNFKLLLSIGLSTITRSNGLLNFGFLLYFALIKRLSILRTFFTILIGLIPFLSFQYFVYFQFCLIQTSKWCNQLIPNFYSYIQNEYWNVGFLKYYQIKQIPNFILAFPVLFLVFHFLRKQFDFKVFPFILHAMFLAIFNILFVHIQVSTRMLFSASPIPYWTTAVILQRFDFRSKFFLVDILFRYRTSFIEQFVCCYFLSYFIVGTVMFSLFLPWT